MVKDPAYRSKKYDESLDPDVIRDRFASQSEAMKEQQRAYFGEIKLIESKAKTIVEEAGVPTIEVAQYINVARKCYSLAKRFSGQTLIDEAQNVVNHWASRGLNGLLLAQVCNLSGCGCQAGVPSGTPLACSIGSVLVCGPDGWQALGPGVACQVLHSRGPGLIPDWTDLITDHGALSGLGDDDHTQYVLRSILTTHGDLFYRNGAGIQRLAPGVSGKYLKTQGAGSPPIWDTPPTGATKDFWEHAHYYTGQLWGHPEGGGVGTIWAMFFTLPHDFTSLVALDIWFTDVITDPSVPLSVTVNAGAEGEAPNTHTETVTPNIPFVANVNNVHHLLGDLSTIPGQLNAGDLVVIHWQATSDADALSVYGVRVRYS